MSEEDVSSAPRTLDVAMITGSEGSSTVATMAAPPVGVPPVADPLVYIVTWAFVSQNDCKLLFAATAC